MNELLHSISASTAVDFLQKKKTKPTDLISKNISEDWDNETRVRSFFSARVAKAELLDSFRHRILQVVQGKMSQNQAREIIKDFLETDGASMMSELGFGDPDSKSISELGSTRRIDLIISENVRQANAIGEYRQLLEEKDLAPWLEYHTKEDGRVRASHAALDGKIYAVDDPIWGTIYPPNDFGCRCWVEEVYPDELEGRKVSTGTPKGINAKNPLSKSGYDFDVTKGMDTALEPKKEWTKEIKDKYEKDTIPFMKSRQDFLEKRLDFWEKEGLKAKSIKQKNLVDDTIKNITGKIAYIANYTKTAT